MQPSQTERWLAALQAFFHTPLDESLASNSQPDAESEVLALFHKVASTVPAYRTFLAEQGIDSKEIQSCEQFTSLPLVTKDNYLQRYQLSELCYDGILTNCDMIAVSSGSTGQPSFWPRFVTDELQIATRFEQVFHDSFEADRRSTLAVVCFALGTWVGGMYTASCCRYLAGKGYSITVVTPGNNKDEIFRVVRELGDRFEQVVLLGYPPFLKDVIDSGRKQGVDWMRYRIKLVMAGEVFSEDSDRNRFLSVVVELAPGVDGGEDRQAAIAASIQAQLLRLNSEFANYVPPEYQTPQIMLASMGDPEYFPVGVKHRYTRA
jgi:phenylacetate-CoA ligase